ncbi:MAG: rhodanese-like domain-containing protein [Sulfurimonas sp.]|nr:rhodanese-like domain-containing protein [Sulfurimonas sp.]
MKYLLSLLMFLSFANAYEGDLTAKEAFEMQKEGKAIIVDVRTTVEFLYTGHGEGFINIPAYYWTYDPKSIETRVQSADYEVKNEKIKDHKSTMKLYNAKELINKNFVNEVMQAMKMQGVESVILVCRSGPRSSAAAEILAKEGITAYNMEDGFINGWTKESLPWGGQ